jgi:ribosomal protein S18 acetylase RimI-like enzyme
MTVLVREATVGDLPRLVFLYEQLAEGRLEAKPAPEAQARKLLVELSSQPGRALVVAEVDGIVVGTLDLLIVANLTHGGAPWGVIENVVVDESARRSGVGGTLIEDAVRRCTDAGCYKIQLLSNKRRTAAHEFYRNVGFEAVAEGFRRYLH